jgi:hypothetical protein
MAVNSLIIEENLPQFIILMFNRANGLFSR